MVRPGSFSDRQVRVRHPAEDNNTEDFNVTQRRTRIRRIFAILLAHMDPNSSVYNTLSTEYDNDGLIALRYIQEDGVGNIPMSSLLSARNLRSAGTISPFNLKTSKSHSTRSQSWETKLAHLLKNSIHRVCILKESRAGQRAAAHRVAITRDTRRGVPVCLRRMYMCMRMCAIVTRLP